MGQKQWKHIVICWAAIVAMHTIVAFADVASTIVNVSNPGLIQKRLQTKVPNKNPSLVKVEQKTEAQSYPGFEKIHLKLNKIILKGNKVFSDKELQTIFQPLMNHTISLADLSRAIDEVTKKYRDAGYILSRAILPPQAIKNGVVTVQIIEGFISQVNVEGDLGTTKSLLNRYGERLTSSRPFKVSLLERDMLLINDLPGVVVKAVISASKTVPAGADLLLGGQRTKTQWNVSYDNYGTRYLGPQEISVKGQFNSMFLPGDSNSLRYETVPHNTEMSFIEFIHTNPIANGLRFTLGGDYTETHPLFVLGPLDVVGRNKYVFTDLTYPVIRTRTKDFFLHGTFNYQNVTSTILGTPFYADRVRSITLGGNVDGIDSWLGSNSLSVNLEHGFNILGANQHFLQSRPLGVSNYTRGTVNASRIQWINERCSLFAAFSGQYAFNPLLAEVQYSYGGPDYGRGYDPSEIVGDSAVAGKAEFRVDTMPSWRFLNDVQYYVFYDAGIVWNRDGIDLLPKQSATSTGIGARFTFIPQLTGNFYIAKPLTHNVGVFEAVNEPRRQWRTFFQLVLNM